MRNFCEKVLNIYLYHSERLAYLTTSPAWWSLLNWSKFKRQTKEFQTKSCCVVIYINFALNETNHIISSTTTAEWYVLFSGELDCISTRKTTYCVFRYKIPNETIQVASFKSQVTEDILVSKLCLHSLTKMLKTLLPKNRNEWHQLNMADSI